MVICPFFIPSTSNIYPSRDNFKVFMPNRVVTKNKSKITPISLNWQDNPSVKTLLDVVIVVLAEEYVRVARENENLFKKGVKCG